MYALNQLNGFAAEALLSKDFLAAAKCRLISFHIETLVKFTSGSIPGRRRLAQCQPWLVREFSQADFFAWEYVPSKEFVDRVLALDLVVNYMGYKIGIDITTNPAERNLTAKLKTHKELESVYQLLDLDKVITIVVEPDFQPQDLRTILKFSLSLPGLVIS